MTTPKLYTVAQVAFALETGTDNIYALCRAGMIGHRRLGPKRGLIRFTESDIQAYLEAARVVPGASEVGEGMNRPVPARKAVQRRPGGSGRPDGKPIQNF